MGLFDSLYLECPDCSTQIEAQSKVGDCCLIIHDAKKVPVSIAWDLLLNDNEYQCKKCGRQYIITLVMPKNLTVELALTPFNDSDC